MNELSLFTGAGGGIWGSKLLGWKTIGYVEKDEYCQKVIRQRIDDGLFDSAPLFSDITLFISQGFADGYSGLVDVITAGFPCQPFSTAGKQLGAADSRNMWPQTLECICRIRPHFALLENVPGLTTHPYFGQILGDLAAALYDCEGDCISANEFGAPHERSRQWILATDSNRGRAYPEQIFGAECQGQTNTSWDGAKKPVANSQSSRRRGSDNCNGIQRSKATGEPGETLRSDGNDNGWWSIEPELGRVADGVANRSHRLKALGNGQVPRVVRAAFERLTDIKQ